MFAEIKLAINETFSSGLNEIYKDEISLSCDESGEETITIGTVVKDRDDDRDVYFVLNKEQAIFIAKTLLNLAETMPDTKK